MSSSWIKYNTRKRYEHLTLHWCHNERDGVSNHRRLDCLNSSVTGEFPSQRPVTRSFDVFFDLRLNKRLSKQPWVGHDTNLFDRIRFLHLILLGMYLCNTNKSWLDHDMETFSTSLAFCGLLCMANPPVLFTQGPVKCGPLVIFCR